MNMPRRRGLALTIIGPIMMLILAPAALGIGLWRGVVDSDSKLDSFSWAQSPEAVQIDDAGERSIVSFDNGGPSPADCIVDGPSGEIDVHPVSYDDGATAGGTYLEVAYFDPDGPGAYQIDCVGDRVKVVPTELLDSADGTFGTRFVIGMCVAGVVFCVGVILLVVGIVKLVRSSQERQQARLAQFGYGYGYGSGYAVPYGAPYGSPPAPYQGGHPPQPPTMGDPDNPYATPTEKQ